MKLLDRYISKVVITSILMVVFVVVGLDGIFALIDELQNLENNYQSQEALQYVVATLPKRFYEFISLSVLIGCLLGLGSLANHSELTVMRAAGMS
ncbi:MAG: LptF/LptG family permease, partial [Pseudomonadales bacterium]|nr:LptF/LptG family permease [Pseudomonadales bacterium]